MSSQAGRTALLVAAAENRPRAVTALAADEAFRTERLESRTYAGNTALHRAAAYGGVPVLRAVIGLHLLSKRPLAASAAIDAVNDKGRTPLVRAARWGRVDEVKELLRAGADASTADKVRGGLLPPAEACAAFRDSFAECRHQRSFPDARTPHTTTVSLPVTPSTSRLLSAPSRAGRPHGGRLGGAQGPPWRGSSACGSGDSRQRH